MSSNSSGSVFQVFDLGLSRSRKLIILSTGEEIGERDMELYKPGLQSVCLGSNSGWGVNHVKF